MPFGVLAKNASGNWLPMVTPTVGSAPATGVVEIASQPAVFLNPLRVAGRLPDFRGAEMRAVRVRITDTLHHGQIAGVVKILETGHRAVEANLAVQLQNLVRRQPDARARVVIKIVRVGHDGVEAVVAAGHLQHDENGRVLAGDDLRGGIRRLACSAVKVSARNAGTVHDSALPRTVVRRNSRRVWRVISFFIILRRDTLVFM